MTPPNEIDLLRALAGDPDGLPAPRIAEILGTTESGVRAVAARLIGSECVQILYTPGRGSEPGIDRLRLTQAGRDRLRSISPRQLRRSAA